MQSVLAKHILEMRTLVEESTIMRMSLENASTNFMIADSYGLWLLFIPFIFAPFTIMMLSLITRRLHNIGLPGWISIAYLFVFILFQVFL